MKSGMRSGTLNVAGNRRTRCGRAKSRARPCGGVAAFDTVRSQLRREFERLDELYVTRAFDRAAAGKPDVSFWPMSKARALLMGTKI